MDTLFDVGDPGERSCRTCVHAVPRHGRHTSRTYPLVCLLMACAVTNDYGSRAGRVETDWPCRAYYDEHGPYPRGWERR